MNCKKQHRYLAEYSTLMDAQDNQRQSPYLRRMCL